MATKREPRPQGRKQAPADDPNVQRIYDGARADMAAERWAAAAAKLVLCLHYGQRFLRAIPNPVPLTGAQNPTTIVWDTGDGSAGEVYVTPPGERTTLLAEGAFGWQEISWIHE